MLRQLATGSSPRSCPGAAVRAACDGVEQVEVGVEALERRAGRRRAPIRTALITFAPVRCATAVAEGRAFVAVQLPSAAGRACRPHGRRISSIGWLTNSAHAVSTLRRSLADDAGGDCQVHVALGRSGHRMKPKRPGAELDRALGVLEPGDAADLDLVRGGLVTTW